MGFIERLRQDEVVEALRKQQLRAQQEAKEAEKLQREAIEAKRRALRRQQAEKFQEESEVSLAVDELVKYLETPIIPIVHTGTYDGLDSSYTEYVGRGSRGLHSKYTEFITSDGQRSPSYGFPFHQRDPDSVFDTVHWDTESLGSSKARVRGSDSHYSEKYTAVETCPDGTIVFHASWLGSTTIKATEWRTKDKKQLFDKALEKAYKNPGVNKYSVWNKPVEYGVG